MCGIAPPRMRDFGSGSGCTAKADDCYPSAMDILKMISDLRKERDQIGEAIIVLERLAARSGKRRGRPPAWMAAMKDKPKRRGRPPGSAVSARA